MIHDLTEGKAQSVLWRFTIPLFISVIFQQLYNIADSVIAGKFAGEDALAAVGASVSNYDDFYGSCSGKQYRVFRDYLSAVWSKEI